MERGGEWGWEGQEARKGTQMKKWKGKGYKRPRHGFFYPVYNTDREITLNSCTVYVRRKNETGIPGSVVTGIVRRASTVVLRADVVSSWTWVCELTMRRRTVMTGLFNWFRRRRRQRRPDNGPLSRRTAILPLQAGLDGARDASDVERRRTRATQHCVRVPETINCHAARHDQSTMSHRRFDEPSSSVPRTFILET